MEKFDDPPELCLFEFATPPARTVFFYQTIPARPPIRVVIKICYQYHVAPRVRTRGSHTAVRQIIKAKEKYLFLISKQQIVLNDLFLYTFNSFRYGTKDPIEYSCLFTIIHSTFSHSMM